MANGETTAVRVTEADLAAVPSPPPEFGRWLRTAYEYGWLNDMVQALIQGGRCTDVQTALIYLQQVSESTRLEIRYAVADFGGKPSAHRINVLRRLLTGDQARRRDPHVWHGMLGHQLVNALFSGKLQSHLVAPPPTTTQLGLFGSDSAVEVAGVMVSTTKHTAALYRRITHLTRLIAPQVKEHGWHGWRRRRRHFIALQQCLLELAPRLVTSVRDVDGFEHEDELFPLTLLSWGAAVAARLKHRRDRVLFTEMPVLHTRHGMSGGRIDAMEVRSINGKQPTRRQLATLRHLVKARERGDDRLRSVGDVLYTITTQFGSRLDVVIYDWKFLVGDLWKRWAEQTLPNLEAPLETHRRQMHRYLTLVPMDLALGRKPTETWHDLGELTLSCELWYFLPHSPALVHTLTLTPDERQRLFRTLARRQGAIHNAAVFRTRTNSVVGHLVRDVLSTSGRGNVNNGGRNGYKKKNGDTVQERLFDQATLAMPTARRLLEAESVASREYVDSLGIIERVQDDRTDGRTRLVLHYDHLLAHLDELHASQFDRERGGALCCLLHDERTPSMRVYLADA